MTFEVTGSILAFVVVLMALGFLGSFVAGLLGIGGAIVMIPLLLYVPPFLAVGKLGVKTAAGITMVQVLVAGVSGTLAHRRHRAVDPDLGLVGGLAMASGTFLGATLSRYADEWWLLLVFALMVTAAAALMVVPVEVLIPPSDSGFLQPERYSRGLTALVTGGVGVAAGLVGAGGAFLVVPFLLVVVRVPMRVTIGSSLAIVSLSAATGVVGKLVTGQIVYGPALAVAAAAIPGAQLGAAVSRRVAPVRLKLALAIVIVIIGLRVWIDVLGGARPS